MLSYELLGEGTPLFLSYSAADVDFALRLAVDLKNAGVYLWMDRLDAVSASWTAALTQARVRSAGVLVILSPAYAASSACQAELAIFQQAEKPIYLLPVAALPEGRSMSADTGIDFSQWDDPARYEEQFYALVDLLSRKARAQVWRPLDADAQYITALLGKLQAPHGNLATLETALSEQASITTVVSRPPPLLAQTDDINTLSVRVPATGAETTPTALISLDQVVSAYPSFVLTAPIGAGKSYTLRSLVLDSLRQYAAEPGTVPLPLLVDLADWNGDPDVSSLIRTQWNYGDDPLELLASGQLALYLDGLSENRPQPGFSARWQALQSWLTSEQTPQRVVITCSPTDAELVGSLGLPSVILTALDREGIAALAAQQLPTDEVNALLAQLDDTTNPIAAAAHRQITNNPYLATALVLRYRSGVTDFPASASAILQWVVEALWSTYTASIDGAPDYAEIETALSGFAYGLTDTDSPLMVAEAEALTHFDRPALLDAAVGAHLLETSGNRVGFAHILLQQYYAALALQHLEIKRRLSKPQLDAENQRVPKKWDAVVRMLIGLVADPDALILTIAAIDPLLALQCTLSSATVTEATYTTLIARTANQPIAAANALVDYDPARAHDLLIEAARSADWETRTAAAQALRRLDYAPEATPPAEAAPAAAETTAAPQASATAEALGIWLHFLNTPQRQLQQEAAKALGGLRDTAAVPFLVDLMQTPNRAISTEAITALGCIGDTAAIPPLVATLAHRDWRISSTAAQALVKIGDAAFPALQQVVQQADSRRQRIHAVEILAQMQQPDAAALVLAFTHSDDLEARFAAVAALQHLDSKTALPRLIECLDDTDQPDWSMQRICDVAANILENMGSREASTAVKKWRLSQLRNIRIGRKSVDAVVNAPAETATVQVALADGAASAPENASTCVPESTPAKSTAKASPKASSGKTVKERLLRVLQRATTQAAPAAAASASASDGDFDWMQQRDRATALGDEPAETAVPELLTLVTHDESQVRAAAITSLAKFKSNEQVLPALLQALRDGEYLVADTAASALKTLGVNPIPGLLYAIRSPDLNVSAAAIDVAGAIGQQDAVPDLINALNDQRKTALSKQRICDLAVEALEKIATPEAITAAQTWRKSQKSPLEQQIAASDGSDKQENLVVLSDTLEAIHSEDWEKRQEAAKLLRDYGKKLRGTTDTDSVKRITTLLDDEAWDIRYAATESLAWIKDATPVPKLTELVKDSQWMVRASAIRALSEIGDPRGLESMIIALSDERSDVRQTAAEALGMMGDKSAVGGLAQALTDPEEFVRVAAVEALGNIGDPAGIIPLHNAIAEADPALRWSIADALRKIAHPDAVPDLIPLLQDTTCPHWEEKRTCDVAASALAAIDTPEARAALEAWKQGPPNH